jgi:hypothetical protein
VNMLYTSTFLSDQDKKDKRNGKFKGIDNTLKLTKVEIGSGSATTKPIVQSKENSDAKILASANMNVFDNELYGIHSKLKRPIGKTILGCVTLPCLVGYGILLNKWNKVGNYSVAKVTVD